MISYDLMNPFSRSGRTRAAVEPSHPLLGVSAPAALQRSVVGPDMYLGDPALASFLGMGALNDAGVAVTESTSLGLTALYRSVEIIAGTIGSLPMKTYRDTGEQMPDGTSERETVSSFLDNPGGDFYTPFEWKHLVMVHLLLHGNAYLLHIYNGAGGIAALFPIHPSMVSVEFDKDAGIRIYKVSSQGIESVVYTDDDITHIMGLSVDGLCGVSPIGMMRNAIGTGIAGDKAAARMFGSGMLLGGLVTPTNGEQLTQEQGDAIVSGLKARLTGSNNAADLAFVSASLQFSPWTMNADDAQFIESREHQVTEIARMFGVPKMLLAEDGASTWGSGIAELNRGLARYTLARWTSCIEERLSRLLPSPRFCEFDFKALLEPSPEIMIPLLIQQVGAGILTKNEARAILNLPPVSDPAADSVAPIGTSGSDSSAPSGAAVSAPSTTPALEGASA